MPALDKAKITSAIPDSIRMAFGYLSMNTAFTSSRSSCAGGDAVASTRIDDRQGFSESSRYRLHAIAATLKLEELPKEDKEFGPFATLRARGGAGTEFMRGEASATRQGMNPPAGSTAPRLPVEASLLLPRRPQQINRRAV